MNCVAGGAVALGHARVVQVRHGRIVSPSPPNGVGTGTKVTRAAHRAWQSSTYQRCDVAVVELVARGASESFMTMLEDGRVVTVGTQRLLALLAKHSPRSVMRVVARRTLDHVRLIRTEHEPVAAGRDAGRTTSIALLFRYLSHRMVGRKIESEVPASPHGIGVPGEFDLAFPHLGTSVTPHAGVRNSGRLAGHAWPHPDPDVVDLEVIQRRRTTVRPVAQAAFRLALVQQHALGVLRCGDSRMHGGERERRYQQQNRADEPKSHVSDPP